MSISAAPTATDSIVANIYDAPDYLDRFVAAVAPSAFERVDDVATAWFTDQPAWLRLLSTNTLSTRSIDAVVSAGRYEIGASVGSWEVIDRTDDEIVFGDDMGFMQYRFSFRLAPSGTQIEGATAVRYLWTRTGRFYFAIVRPMHRRFIKLMLSTIVDSGRR